MVKVWRLLKAILDPAPTPWGFLRTLNLISYMRPNEKCVPFLVYGGHMSGRAVDVPPLASQRVLYSPIVSSIIPIFDYIFISS